MYGRLPLHYSVDKDTPDIGVVLTLLKAFPEGASVKDSQSRLPLAVACEYSSHAAFQVVKHLFAAFPDGISSIGQHGRVPLCIAVESPQPNIACVHFLATKNPEAIWAPMRLGKDQSSPLSIAMAGNKMAVVRTLLMAIPLHDPQRLRDLHWGARKIAILLGMQPPPPESNLEEQEWEGEEEQQTTYDGATTDAPASLESTTDAAGPTSSPLLRGDSIGRISVPTLNINADKYEAPYIIQLSTQHLLLSKTHEANNRFWRDRRNSINSIHSEPESAMPTGRDAILRCNLYQKLYSRDMDAFKIAVKFL